MPGWPFLSPWSPSSPVSPLPFKLATDEDHLLEPLRRERALEILRALADVTDGRLAPVDLVRQPDRRVDDLAELRRLRERDAQIALRAEIGEPLGELVEEL